MEQSQREDLERRLREAEERAETAEQEARELKQETQKTTFVEYLNACHHLLSSRLVVQTNPNLTSKGSLTSARNKWCPTALRPWEDFLEQQRIINSRLYDLFPTNLRVFESRHSLAAIGERIGSSKVGDEKALEKFLHNSTEDPVRFIFEQLRMMDGIADLVDMGNGIEFANHPHAISDAAEEVIAASADQEGAMPPRLPAPSTPPQTPAWHQRQAFSFSTQLRPDQICVYRWRHDDHGDGDRDGDGDDDDEDDDSTTPRRAMLYVSEYKAPHKLTAPHLRQGLRPMQVHDQVVNRKTRPTESDPQAKFEYDADRLTATAVTQTYHYMVEAGLDHGLLTTGEAIVFLKIDWDEPEVLRYHLAEPRPEVDAHPDHAHHCTAVGQYLAFTLMALAAVGECRHEPHRTQDRRQTALRDLKTWTEDFESVLHSIPKSERTWSSGSSPAWEPSPRTYADFDRSPAPPRKRRRLGPASDEGEEEDDADDGHNHGTRGTKRRGSPESSDDETPTRPSATTVTQRQTRSSGWTTRQQTHQSQPDETQSQNHSGQGRQAQQQQDDPGQGETEVMDKFDAVDTAHAITPALDGDTVQKPCPKYCTHQCLLSLVRGQLMDPNCPNVTQHQRGDRSRNDSHQDRDKDLPPRTEHHAISHDEFLRQLRQQMEITLDHGITPLALGGARSVLFKVTLLAYGYTFVCKGTVQAFIRDLDHEAALYKRLERIQGRSVPVFLGVVDLRALGRTYYYDHRVYIIHMTCLSWGGVGIEDWWSRKHPRRCNDACARDHGAMQQRLRNKAAQSLQAVHGEGVLHTDVRAANVLYDDATDTVLVIDFERAKLMAPPSPSSLIQRRRPLTQLVPNKRRRQAADEGESLMLEKQQKKRRLSRKGAESLFAGERRDMGWIFT